jgi:hypothetical protein
MKLRAFVICVLLSVCAHRTYRGADSFARDQADSNRFPGWAAGHLRVAAARPGYWVRLLGPATGARLLCSITVLYHWAATARRAWSSVSTLAIPTVVQAALSSSSSRSIAAWYSIETGPIATRSPFSFRITRMKFTSVPSRSAWG